jgi:DNA-binding transcriptional LysR family regulator
MLRYTLRQLEYAIAAQESGSVAQAAQRLGVAQPTLSAAIAKLEDQLGLQLFIRHHAQGVSVAPQARAFFAEARNLITHARDIERSTQSTGMDVQGTLSLGSFTTIASAFAPKLIATFTARHPAAVLKLEEGAQDSLLDGLRGGHFDAALLYDVDLPADLEVRHLAAFAPHILLPAAHSLARRKRLHLKSLRDEPLILLDIAPSRTYFLRLLNAAGIAPRIAFSSPSLEVVRGLVGQGLGYSILITRPFGDRAYSGEALSAVAIADDAEKGVVALASLRRVRKTRLALAFEDHCAAVFAQRQPFRRRIENMK